MKKIITLNLTILFLTISNSNALDFNEYYELPEKNKIDYSKIKNSKLFIKNQQFSNEFDDIKKHYPISKNSYENPKIIFTKPTENKGEVSSKTIIEYQEITKVQKKSRSRTVGNYLGIDFINTNLRYFDQDIRYMLKYKNSFGLKYFYALNYNGFFLAPELFFEYNNIKKFNEHNSNSNIIYNERMPWRFGQEFLKIHKIYGGKINFGYDVNPDFAPFVFVGISKIYYSNRNSVYPEYAFNLNGGAIDIRQYMLNHNQQDPFLIMRNSTITSLFGLGAKIKLSERFLLNMEYLIYKKFKASKVYKNYNIDNSEIHSTISDFSNQFKADLRVAKIGLLYNF